MRFSIITINFNHADGLENTIQSVINQTCHDYEFIIIDGGSSDGSVDVIRKYKENINNWVSEPDGGIFPAMNKGTRQAHGDYCIYMNSGDTFYDNRVLEKVKKCNYTEDIQTGSISNGGQIRAYPIGNSLCRLWSFMMPLTTVYLLLSLLLRRVDLRTTAVKYQRKRFGKNLRGACQGVC